MNFNSFPRCHCLESWMMVVPVINAVHITPEDRAFLAKHGTSIPCCAGNVLGSPLILLAITVGLEHFSSAFRNIARELVRLHYCYVRFDPDGQLFDDLSTFGEVSSELDNTIKKILTTKGAQ
jgi:hypothetical protein